MFDNNIKPFFLKHKIYILMDAGGKKINVAYFHTCTLLFLLILQLRASVSDSNIRELSQCIVHMYVQVELES